MLIGRLSPEIAEHLRKYREQMSRAAVLDVIVGRLTSWSAPGVLLLGDAAHPMSPVGGQGINIALRDSLVAAIPRIRRHTDLPVCIGFGIRTPQQAAEAARLADGAVVGTALVDTLAASLDEQGRARPETVRQVLDQVRGLAEAIRAKEPA